MVDRVHFDDACSRVAYVAADDVLVVQQYQDARAAAQEGVDVRVRYQLVIYVDAHCLEDPCVLFFRVGLLGIESALEGF